MAERRFLRDESSAAAASAGYEAGRRGRPRPVLAKEPLEVGDLPLWAPLIHALRHRADSTTVQVMRFHTALGPARVPRSRRHP